MLNLVRCWFPVTKFIGFFFQIELITPKSGTLYIPHLAATGQQAWSTSLQELSHVPLNWILTQQLQERATE